ncbi:MAG: PAC2 family protein [Candidatus Caldarchaeum sp.]|nr:PAC2 family protein [Candidatus Caldarchaeum sp.]
MTQAVFTFLDELGTVKKPLIVGFPDTGLAGAIAVSYLVEQLKPDEKGYIDSREMPPIVPVRRGTPKELMRIYEAGSFITVVSEVPIPPPLIREFSDSLIDWALQKKVSWVGCFSGVAEPRRLEIDVPKVFMLSSEPKKTEELSKKLNIEVFTEGFVTGVHAEILRLGMRRGIEVNLFLAQSHLNYPDPGAAARLISLLPNLVHQQIDIKPLLESEESIRIQLRDLMRRTSETMVQKSREMELPPVYR